MTRAVLEGHLVRYVLTDEKHEETDYQRLRSPAVA